MNFLTFWYWFGESAFYQNGRIWLWSYWRCQLVRASENYTNGRLPSTGMGVQQVRAQAFSGNFTMTRTVSNVLARVGKTGKTGPNWNTSRPWIGLFQGAKCKNVSKFNLEFAWGKSDVVTVIHFHLFILFFLLLLLFPPNICALLALDTGQLRVSVINEGTRRYLNL